MADADELAAPLRHYMAIDGKDAAGGYSDPSTWESRYEEQHGTFDWYATYKELRQIFEDFCRPDPELDVLMLGCGNSALSGEMHEAGFRQVVNIDIAASAVKQMQDRFADLGMEWRVMDATAMSFEDCSFNLTVDKGTLDAMMHGGDSGECLAAAMTAEVWRTLRPGGLFFLISHNGHRQPVLDSALEAGHGPLARWELLELRKCSLSPQAMLINILRSKLKGRPLNEGFKDPELMAAAAAETRMALKQMQFLEAFRLFKARKMAQQQGANAGVPSKKESAVGAVQEGESDDEGPRDPRRQPFCWVYILQKPA